MGIWGPNYNDHRPEVQIQSGPAIRNSDSLPANSLGVTSDSLRRRAERRNAQDLDRALNMEFVISTNTPKGPR